MQKSTKTGSSRRKGDEYQDLTALRLALELYIEGAPFELFIEYEKAGNLDDIVVQRPLQIDAYQVKHAVDPHATYSGDDFLDDKSNVYFGKFAASWKQMAAAHPDLPITVHLRTNRHLDSDLAQIVDADGHFDEKFQQGRYRKEKGRYRQDLERAASITASEFLQLIARFHFDVGHPSWRELEHYIQAMLLDHQLGISDRQVFAELKSLVERHAIETHSPITPDLLDTILRESQSRFLLSQRFSIEEQRFVEPPTLADQLDQLLSAVDGDYIVVTGPPGSGKSTALTKYFDALDRSDYYHVVRYYCFVRIDDNQQRLRLEAQSLRVNLLAVLNRPFAEVMDRRFDMSEDHFLSSLERLGTHCRSERTKLVVFVDGLDHAERDGTVLNDVIQALPAKVPAGVVFVVGTQELRHWTPLALRHGREQRHIQMPLFSRRESELYLRTRCQLVLSDSGVQQVQAKSAGLPLYLRYIAELMATTEYPEDLVQSLPATVEGDIRHYYEMLWNAFDAKRRGDAKYLCFVLALLRFRVHRAELYGFQQSISSRGGFDEAYRHVWHLLKDQDGLIGIFHNSFRAFVLDRLDLGVRQEIVAAISNRLKQEDGSTRWYKHALAYAAEAKDRGYVLSRVNREFVDQALLHNRDSDTIEDALMCAVAAAAEEGDIVELSKLGSLRHRTNERLEYQFPWLTRAETLLRLGRVDDVLTEFYSENSERLEVSHGFALQICLWLKELGKDSLAEKLFRDVLDDRDRSEVLGREGIIDLARCAGAFPTHFAKVMRWLAGATVNRDMLEPQGFEPEYAPHLEAYLNAVVEHKPDHTWEWMKPLDQPFASKTIRYYIIRAVAQCKPTSLLAREIDDYVRRYPDERNVELAFLATKARMPAVLVHQLAGQFSMPKESVGDYDHAPELQREAKQFAYWGTILAYTRDGAAEPVKARLRGDNSVWAATLGHLLLVGQLLSANRTSDNIDWFGTAIDSIERLKTASHVAYERTPDALDASRFILLDSLRWASEIIAERCPERINDLVTALVDLRTSFIWTTHYGINEQVNDYSFEFPLWRRLAQLPAIRYNLRPILASCAESYTRASKLKGGSRGAHFLELSAIAARCGFRDDAERWLREGVNGTLSYGYCKDTTLMKLGDVLRRANKHKPEKAFARSADVLELIKWMPHVSDGRETQYFPQQFFPVVLDADRHAGLDLLRFYYERFGRWQANDCTKTYILSCNSGDPEYLWALASLLHPNESLKCRQHIVDHSATDSSIRTGVVPWSERLVQYVATSINPAQWPEEMKAGSSPGSNKQQASAQDEWSGLDRKPVYLDGVAVTEDRIIEFCKQSVGAMVETLDKLRTQNEYVSDYRILDATVPFHIGRARSDDDLAQIEGLVETRDVYARASYFARLGARYIGIGNLSHGSALLEKAFRDSVSTTTVESCIAVLAGFDTGAARRLCIEGIRNSLVEASYHGHDTPCIAAAACEILGESEKLDQVFEGFLVHCQELFRYLPSNRWFDWLGQYVPTKRDANSQIVDIVIDQLGEPEIELGRRLMAAACDLCCERPSAVDSVVERSAQVEGLPQGRLLQVLHALAYCRPESVRQHAQAVAPMLEQTNAIVKLLVRDTLQAAFRGIEVPKEVLASLAQVDRDYSSVIAYRTFRILHADVSSEFRELLDRAPLLDFHRQLEGCCDVLGLNVDLMKGHLERRFMEKGGTVTDEIEEYKEDWRGYVHPQGWPRRWIIPRFHVKITELLGEVLDEILCKTRVRPESVEAVWRILQPSDPLYLAGSRSVRPSDVPSLVVSDDDQWLRELEASEDRMVLPDFQSAWVTVFEYRELAQAGPHDVDYRSKTHVSSALFRPEHLDADDLTEIRFENSIVRHHPYESLTWDQFQQAIMDATRFRPDDQTTMWPVASIARSPRAFVGFPFLASLCPYIIGEHDLEFKDFLTLEGDVTVARYEMWREGWFSSDYSDEPMSFGCRLQVSAEFLRKACSLYHRAFVVRREETRESYESFKNKPVRSRAKAAHTIVPISPHEDHAQR